MTEEWRDIMGYEGLYQISNLGRVKSLRLGKDLILKPAISAYGYHLVGLSKKNYKRITTSVHKLVAIAFLGNHGDGHNIVVNHKDLNKINNRVDNLEWCTAKQNRHHADLHGVTVRGEDHGRAKLTAEEVAYIRRTYVKRKHGYLHMSKEFNVNKTTIKDIIIGKNWKHTRNQTTIEQ